MTSPQRVRYACNRLRSSSGSSFSLSAVEPTRSQNIIVSLRRSPAEVVGRQIGQQLGIDVILAECRLVPFKTDRSQPVCDVHCHSLAQVKPLQRLMLPAHICLCQRSTARPPKPKTTAAIWASHL